MSYTTKGYKTGKMSIKGEVKEVDLEKFGAFDSELMRQEIFIPEGFEATIDGNKIILKKIESEDEKIRKFLIKWIQDNYYHGTTEIPTKTLIAWLEKQGEHKKFRDSIQVGDEVTRNSDGVIVNLSQLKRVAKKSEQKLPIEKLPEEMKTIGESLEFTTQKECDDYNKMVTELIMSDDDKGEQKPTDKIESKFEIERGKWYVCDTPRYTDFIVDKVYYCPKNGMLKPNENEMARYVAKDCFHLWTIDDAKNGDILADKYGVYIYDQLDISDESACVSICGYQYSDKKFEPESMICNKSDFYPATKEQRDLLFQKIKEAGYEWDAEKLELKKIEDEEYNGEDYGIDGLYHAQRILEKTLGKVDGYQSDDGILEHKCAITAVKKLYKQKPANWSEEDSVRLQRIIDFLWYNRKGDTDTIYQQEQDIDWLKSLKEKLLLLL